MIKKTKAYILALSVILVGALSLAVPVTVKAADTIKDKVCSGAQDLQLGGSTPCPDSSGATKSINDILTTVIDYFSVIVGVVAVIMIVVGGFRYITSGGASDKVKGAKDTLLYAIIGLIVVALAQVIVKFVLSKST